MSRPCHCGCGAYVSAFSECRDVLARRCNELASELAKRNARSLAWKRLARRYRRGLVVVRGGIATVGTNAEIVNGFHQGVAMATLKGKGP